MHGNFFRNLWEHKTFGGRLVLRLIKRPSLFADFSKWCGFPNL